jgi:hypothetical protein
MRDNSIRDQHSVWFFLDESESPLYPKDVYARLDNIYVDALPRDISMHIMPIGGTSKARKEFAISIVPENEKLDRIIAEALAEQRGGYYGRQITPAVCEFVERVASRLMYYGKAVFEIVLLRDRETKDPVGCDLFEINVRSLVFGEHSVVQNVPTEIAAERNVPETIELDPERLIIFNIPRGLGDIAELKRSLAHLGGGSLTRMYETVREDNKLGYDIKEHIRAEHLAIAAATRSTGWSANQPFYELFTEYYVLRRRLVFERFVIALRESILATLNVGISKVAANFGITARLQVSGLPTLADVGRAEKELAAGERTFGSVLDDFTLL